LLSEPPDENRDYKLVFIGAAESKSDTEIQAKD
jgi:hypothetical protein